MHGLGWNCSTMPLKSINHLTPYMPKYFKWGLVNIDSFNGIVMEVIEFLLCKANANVAKNGFNMDL